MTNTAFDRLKHIQKLNTNPNWKNGDLYRLMYRPELYITAYEKIKSRPGNMSPSEDGETLDGFSMKTIERIISEMRTCKFQFKPSKRIEIPKASGGKRIISIPPPRDKVVQQVILFILESIYDNSEKAYFLDCSHGFRHGRNPHTALKEISSKWTGTRWFIEGDVKACFDTIDRNILEKTLRIKIEDERFLNLIRKALNAGYYYFKQKYDSMIGAQQGSIISPILSNIYLDPLDQFISEVCNRHTKGKRRKENREYAQIKYHINDLIKAGHKRSDKCVKTLEKQKLSMPSVDLNDPGYTRAKYIRFCDDFLIGITGSKSQAEHIRAEVAEFMRNELSLEMNMEKSHITHAYDSHAKFLGMYISSGKARDVAKRVKTTSGTFSKVIPRRTGQQTIYLKIPTIDILKRLADRGYCKRTDRNYYKPKHVGFLTAFSDQDIVKHYSAVWRGIKNYFSCSDYISPLNTIKYILKTSCVLTLSAKHRRSAHETYRKHGHSIKISYTNPDNGKTKQTNLDQSSNNEKKKFRINEDVDRMKIWLNLRSRSALDQNCKICNSEEQVEMHHVRHIRKIGSTIKGFHKVMASLNRKQIPVCKDCHGKIHKGEYDSIALKDLAY